MKITTKFDIGQKVYYMASKDHILVPCPDCKGTGNRDWYDDHYGGWETKSCNGKCGGQSVIKKSFPFCYIAKVATITEIRLSPEIKYLTNIRVHDLFNPLALLVLKESLCFESKKEAEETCKKATSDHYKALALKRDIK